MKNWFILITACICIYISFEVYRKPYSSCDKPIPYRLGDIDARFNLTSQEVRLAVARSTSIWHHTVSKDLFVEDPSAVLTVNLVYDQRQQILKEINSLNDSLKNQKKDLSSKETQFENELQSFKQQLGSFNEQVRYWNSRGGAPKDEYENLNQTQEILKTKAQELKQMAQELNSTGQGYNNSIDELNQNIDTFNTVIEERPEEGLYDPNLNRIDIYFNINRDELIHTITHELGHALNLEHTSDPQSIMYPQTSQTLQPTASDIEQVRRICKEQFIGEVFLKEKLIPRVQQLVQRLRQS